MESPVQLYQRVSALQFLGSGSSQHLCNRLICPSSYRAGNHFKQSWFHLLLLIHRFPLPPHSYVFTGTERWNLARTTSGDKVNEGRRLSNSYWASWAPLDCWWQAGFWAGLVYPLGSTDYYRVIISPQNSAHFSVSPWFEILEVSERGKAQVCCGTSLPFSCY